MLRYIKRTSISYYMMLIVILTLSQIVCICQQKNAAIRCPIDADIWVLAGQSNMEGNGRTPDTTTNPNILMLNMDNHWMIAQNPLHRFYEAAAFAYEKDYFELFIPHLKDSLKAWEKWQLQYKKLREMSKNEPIGGVGPGIYFAKHIFDKTGRPVALLPCALGGSTIEQWDPSGKSLGDSSLYGATINKINLVGRNIKGILWWQGESEALAFKTETYEDRFLNLIDSFRKDIGNPELPIIYVQIGKFNIRDSVMDREWEKIREIQRDILIKRNNVFMVTGIDLPLDDCIHSSTEGQKKVGRRIAEMALTYVYKLPGHARQINLESMKLCQDKESGSYYIKVNYSGVCGNLKSCGLPGQYSLRLNGKENIMYVVTKVQLNPEDNDAMDVYLSGLPDTPAQLVSGAGTYPYMNITDSLDNALPAFGPINIPLK